MTRKKNKRRPVTDIAVIGMSCRYPGATDLRHFWENILSKRQQFRRIPDVRLSREYYDPDPKTPDKTYGSKAALIDSFDFKWIERRIPRTSYESTDISHWLALELAISALQNAGYENRLLSKEKTGVIVGNTLTGEHTRSNTMRLRWPFVRRALAQAASAKGLSPDLLTGLEDIMEEYYKSVFPPVTEDSLAGGLSNTIAGRICNYLDLHGGGYTVDGACSSSLIAVITAANALVNGELDLALAGGVDISLDTFELVGFAKTGALSKGEMRVYDKNADGFIPGEGCGFVVLKRLKDALADKDNVYAVIRGWGISSDGKGGITAPKAETQALALRRAYEMAGYTIHDIHFIEGHGTGTKAGDLAELEGISHEMNRNGTNGARACGITSLKSIIGHTKAAAGIGGLIKAIMAVNRRVLPPTAGCSVPNPFFDISSPGLYPILDGVILELSETMRAGVSAMGFGGINAHVTLESYGTPSALLQPSLSERLLLASRQDTDIIPITASSLHDLKEKAKNLVSFADGTALCELSDLSAAVSRDVDDALAVRAAIVASSPEDLVDKLEMLISDISMRPPASGHFYVSPRKEVWIGNMVPRKAIGFLYPGQGSQKLNMVRFLTGRFPWAKEMMENIDNWLLEAGSERISPLIYRKDQEITNPAGLAECLNQLSKTEIAQPALCAASLIWTEFLCRIGIAPDVVGGHSLGELTAFSTVGAFDSKDLIKFAAIRGRAMSSNGRESGIMASLNCGKDSAEKLLGKTSGYVVISNLNSPTQTVVSGETDAVESVIHIARSEGITCRKLSVSNAFHSELVSDAAEYILTHFPVKNLNTDFRIPVISSVLAKRVVSGIDLKTHFASQILSQVDFISLIHEMASKCKLFVEIGPGSALTGLAAEICGDKRVCLPIESEPKSTRDLNTLLGALFVNGHSIRWELLFENRLIRPFVPAADRIFIGNPCERPFRSARNGLVIDQPNIVVQRNSVYEKIAPPGVDLTGSSRTEVDETKRLAVSEENSQIVSGGDSIEEYVIDLASRVTGFPKTVVWMDAHLQDDLNLDSIKSGELIAIAARENGITGKIDSSTMVNASLKDIIEVIRKIKGDSGLPVEQDSGINPSEKAQQFQNRQSSFEWERLEPWVRNYSLHSFEEDIGTFGDAEINNAEERNSILCVYENEKDNQIGPLVDRFTSENNRADCVTFDKFREDDGGSFDGITHLIAILPRQEQEDFVESRSLRKAVHRLQSVAKRLPSASAAKSPDLEAIVFVTFGGGFHGEEKSRYCIDSSCVNSFASSLSLEYPDYKIRVIDFDIKAGPGVIASRIFRELAIGPAFVASGYDEALTRRVAYPVLMKGGGFSSRDTVWTPEDVVIVTGGGKGITAECAFAFAERTRARLALVGSSPHPSDMTNEQVSSLLERFSNAGLVCRYYQCDITRENEIISLVETITKEMGEITGLIHGAGLNKPGRTALISTGDAMTEISPKVLGIAHLCRALNGHPLKLLMGFSSIIGVTGLAGNAWYAFSNEAVDLIIRKFAAENPDIPALSIAYSVWSEIGMGARMGIVGKLAKQGISPIPPEEGVRRFLQFVENDPCSKQIIISSRLGVLHTWQPKLYEKTIPSRFIDEILFIQPGVELIARARLDIERDRFAKDHCFRGSFLFPLVFGLEAMFQSVACVTGLSECRDLRVEQIMLERPIVVDSNSGVMIEIHAQVTEKLADDSVLEVRAGIRTEHTGFLKDHFSAVFILNHQPDKLVLNQNNNKSSLYPLPIFPRSDLYGSVLFQGPLFQRIEEIVQLSCSPDWEGLCSFRSRYVHAIGRGAEQSYGDYMLGDPFFRDSLFQSMQLMIPQDISLPVYIDRIDMNLSRNRIPDLLSATTKLQGKQGNEYTCSVTVNDPDGILIEEIRGCRLRIIEHRPQDPSIEDLVDPGERDESILQTELEKRSELLNCDIPSVSVSFHPTLTNLSKEERHIHELPILERAVKHYFQRKKRKPEAISFSWIESGKPVAISNHSNIGVSLSHDDRVCMCIADRGRQGCDIVSMKEWGRDDWASMIGNSRIPLLDQLMTEVGDSAAQAGARIWASLESFKKATGFTEDNFTVKMTLGDSVILESSCGEDTVHVLTFPVSLTLGAKRMVGVTVNLISLPPQSINMEEDCFRNLSASYMSNQGPQGQASFVHRFPLTFREASMLGKGVYFSNIFKWMGEIRELSIKPVLPNLVDLLSSGKWGMVTNYSQANYYGKAQVNDIIEGRLWIENITGKFNSTVEMGFEWYRGESLGNYELLGSSRQAITWVSIIGKGIVKPAPFPEFYKEFIDRRFKRADLKTRSLPQKGDFAGKGRVIYETESMRGVPLSSVIFETALEDGNLVGNIYFANYYIWQGRVLDKYLHSVIPWIYNEEVGKQELICTFCRVDHIREALPFEKIVVAMSLKSLHECGLSLLFEYCRVDSDEKKDKLAVGSFEGVWVRHTGERQTTPCEIPYQLKLTLNRAIESSKTLQ